MDVEWQLVGSFAGGIGLFLLGMRLLTEGLKMAAGEALRHILARWTSTPLRGLSTGVLITSMVQSSSAVTVATLGFVNAGLLTLLQTIYVIYGSNIGTTMTSWLVAIVGFKLDIQGMALPLIGLGMALWLTGGRSRRAAFGEVLAGFGLFFLGIAILKESFGSLGGSLPLHELAADGGNMLLFVAIGFLLTFLMQSSSAAMAVTLTAAAGGLMPLSAAAATVIGANVGTTSTAALAVIGSTSNAQRAAAAHVLFNLLTAMVALLLLGPMLELIAVGFPEGGVATVLALFHTIFNLLGVALMWWLTPTLVHFLEGRFRSIEEDEGRPRYLDRNVMAAPGLALDALAMELERIGAMALGMGRAALSVEHHPGRRLEQEHGALERLVRAVSEFCVELQHGQLTKPLGEALPVALRVARYYQAVGASALALVENQQHRQDVELEGLAETMARFRSGAVELLKRVDHLDENYSLEEAEALLEELERDYQQLKSQLLQAGASERLKVREMVGHLDLYSLLRRELEQAFKGARYLHRLRDLAERVRTEPEGKEEKEDEATEEPSTDESSET